MDSIHTLSAESFPPLLSEITDPPEKLYIKGEFPLAEKYLTVVGTRKPSSYGKDVMKTLIAGLRGLPVVIVSGLALGTDALAHEAALENNILTVAVPGSGLSDKVLYPAANRELAKKILQAGGCLISEFEPEFKATDFSFPQRNRIMAGLSHATLVIEAQLKSGTLITSKFATQYNRDILAVPGSIFSSLSEGPHMLIRLGATPVTTPEELREALGFKIEEKEKESYKHKRPVAGGKESRGASRNTTTARRTCGFSRYDGITSTSLDRRYGNQRYHHGSWRRDAARLTKIL